MRSFFSFSKDLAKMSADAESVKPAFPAPGLEGGVANAKALTTSTTLSTLQFYIA